MIDIHCHILWGIDDGSASAEESLEMGRIAAACDVSDIIATPHCIPGRFENYCGSELDKSFELLFEGLSGSRTASSLRIHRGMEVFASPDTLADYDDGALLSLADSRYMLIECAFDETPSFFRGVLKGLASRGVHPVIAHPERYFFAQDDLRYLFDFLDMGCSLQLDTSSIAGGFGRRCRETAMELLASGAVQLAASDAHDADIRSPDMRPAWEIVANEFTARYADLIFNVNPRRILQDDRLRFPGREELDRRERRTPSSRPRFMTDEEYWGD